MPTPARLQDRKLRQNVHIIPHFPPGPCRCLPRRDQGGLRCPGGFRGEGGGPLACSRCLRLRSAALAAARRTNLRARTAAQFPSLTPGGPRPRIATGRTCFRSPRSRCSLPRTPAWRQRRLPAIASPFRYLRSRRHCPSRPFLRRRSRSLRHRRRVRRRESRRHSRSAEHLLPPRKPDCINRVGSSTGRFPSRSYGRCSRRSR